jgi:lipid-binding SYLF domain-containing protein
MPSTARHVCPAPAAARDAPVAWSRPGLFALLLALLALVAGSLRPAQAGEAQDRRADDAVRVLHEIQRAPDSSIPDRLLDQAHAIVVIPDVVKASFVFGARFGRGLMVVRGADGTWSNPVFVTLTGGSVGFQAGVQSTDVVLVFTSERGVNSLVDGDFTLGADAGVAAGPVGRNAQASTNGRMNAEIWSWSRSRGLFAGVSLDGSVMRIDLKADRAVYGESTPRMIFENRTERAPSAAVVAFRDAIEEAVASARYDRRGEGAAPPAAPAERAATPASTTPLTPEPLPDSRGGGGG